MDKKYLIIILLAFLFLYLSEPVPSCKYYNDLFINQEAIYSIEEVKGTKNLTAVMLNVIGTSMLPAVQDHSQCLCLKNENYYVGDIVFFFAEIDGEINGISHRIVKIDGEEIYTKGDNNNWVDPPMTKESIVCSVPNVPRYKVLFP